MLLLAFILQGWIVFVNLLATTSAAAHPHLRHGTNHAELVEKTLDARQILEANPWVNCCLDCTSAYDFGTFWHVFDDFCGWAGNGMELWTDQGYYTGNYYCQPDSDYCIHLVVQYLCGGGSAYPLDYYGCMNYFLFIMNPPNRCGGPPYPGAHVESADNCWIFQTTADASKDAVNRIELECDASGRWCHLPGSNNTLAIPYHTFDTSPSHIHMD